MQIETTMGYHYTPIRMAKLLNTDNKGWWGCGATGTLVTLLVGMQSGTATLEDSLVVSYKTKYTLTTWSDNLAPWYLPKGIENLCPHKNLICRVFIAALFIIAKIWKQPRCPSVGKWINKLWYIQTIEYYSALKRNEGFPGGTVVKNVPANAGDTGSSPDLGRSHMPRSN